MTIREVHAKTLDQWTPEELRTHDTNPDQLFDVVVSISWVQDVSSGPFVSSEQFKADLTLEQVQQLIRQLKENSEHSDVLVPSTI